MKEIEYNGHKYRYDEGRIRRDGELLDIPQVDVIENIEQIEALLVQGAIFYNDKWYLPQS